MLYQTGASRRGAPSVLQHAGICLLIALLATTVFPCLRVLVIEVDGQIISAQISHFGDKVVSSYVHSVEKTRVEEILRVEGDVLRLVRTEMVSLGAGLPATESLGFSFVGGKYVLLLDQKMPRLQLLLYPPTLPALKINDVFFDLSAYPTGTSVNVRVLRRPLLWLYVRRFTT